MFTVYSEFKDLLSKQSPIESYTEWIDDIVEKFVLKVSTIVTNCLKSSTCTILSQRFWFWSLQYWRKQYKLFLAVDKSICKFVIHVQYIKGESNQKRSLPLTVLKRCFVWQRHLFYTHIQYYNYFYIILLLYNISQVGKITNCLKQKRQNFYFTGEPLVVCWWGSLLCWTHSHLVSKLVLKFWTCYIKDFYDPKLHFEFMPNTMLVKTKRIPPVFL